MTAAQNNTGGWYRYGYGRAWCSPLFIFTLALCVLTMIGKFNF